MKYIFYIVIIIAFFCGSFSFLSAADFKSERQSSTYIIITSPDQKYEILLFTIKDKNENYRELKIREKGGSPFDETFLLKFKGQDPKFNWIDNKNLEISFSQSDTEGIIGHKELKIKLIKR